MADNPTPGAPPAALPPASPPPQAAPPDPAPATGGAHRATPRFRDAIALLTALDATAAAHPDLPELHPACLHADGIDMTPWLLCRPVTALARWMEALPSPSEVAALDLGDIGTRLSVTATLGDATVTLQVITHVGDLRTAAPGIVNATELAALAANEPEMPDLRALHTPAARPASMPALERPMTKHRSEQSDTSHAEAAVS